MTNVQTVVTIVNYTNYSAMKLSVLSTITKNHPPQLYWEFFQFWSSRPFLVLLFTLCCAEEDYRPEALLTPRNFNPHPYILGYDRGESNLLNTGPVLFPKNEDVSDVPDSGIVRVGGRNDDATPYQKVAKKRKYLQSILNKVISPNMCWKINGSKIIWN